MSDYLWDKTGEPEADVEELENLLGALKYQPRPLDIPASAMPAAAKARPTTMSFSRPRLAIAASLLLMLLAGMWFVTRQTERQPDRIATVNKGSEAGGNSQPDKTSGTNESKGDIDDSVNSAGVDKAGAKKIVTPKPREDRASILTASAPKVQRAPRALEVRRQKLRPRRSVEDAPATQEFIAAQGGMRWESEQPLTPEQRAATEQLMLALRVASVKFNYAQREMQEIGRAGK